MATKVRCKIPNYKSQISNKSQCFKFKYPNDCIRKGNYWTGRELSAVGLRGSISANCYWKLRTQYRYRIDDPKSRYPFQCGMWVSVIGYWDLRFICNLVLVFCNLSSCTNSVFISIRPVCFFGAGVSADTLIKKPVPSRRKNMNSLINQ